MRLERYSVELESLRSVHLEMVRLWRNQDYVRQNMQFQQELTREDQEKWFENLDQELNLYWIIRSHGYPIGLIHVKNIDEDLTEGEAGIFVGEPSYLEMPQPMLAILFMMELSFLALGIKRLRAKIKSGNHRAISFNQKLGYELKPGQSQGFQYYYVGAEEFLNTTERIRAQSTHMFGDATLVTEIEKLNTLNSELIKGLSRSDEHFRPKFT